MHPHLPGSFILAFAAVNFNFSRTNVKRFFSLKNSKKNVNEETSCLLIHLVLFAWSVGFSRPTKSTLRQNHDGFEPTCARTMMDMGEFSPISAYRSQKKKEVAEVDGFLVHFLFF